MLDQQMFKKEAKVKTGGKFGATSVAITVDGRNGYFIEPFNRKIDTLHDQPQIEAG
jgi:hypothetical protein